MPRYELGSELWDITKDGKRLVIVTGTGRSAKESTRLFVSAEKADVQFLKLIAEKVAAGYVLIEGRSRKGEDEGDETIAEPHDPALEAAIIANPYDESAYSVYGDWLQSQGAPRGELIALQLAEEADPNNRKLAAATRDCLARRKELTAGIENDLDLTNRQLEPALVWRFGFIHRIALGREIDGDYSIAPVLERVLRHPSGRFVTEIEIREDQASELGAAIPMIGKHAPRTLRAVSLIAHGTLGGFDPLVHLPLTHLTVKGRRRGDLRSELAPQCLRSLARVPATLQSLAVRFGGAEPIDELALLFRRTDLTALTELRLRGWSAAGEVCRRLAASPFAHQLVSIDLGIAEIETTGLAVLADRAKFPALRRVGVAFDLVSTRQIAPLKALGIKLEDRRTDPDDTDEADEDFFDEIQE